MNLADLNFERGTLLNICASNSTALQHAYQYFGDLHAASPSMLEVAEVACHPSSGGWRVSDSTSVAAWLANDADMPLECAQDIINSFPMPVAPQLNQIAMNPCRFLGLASSISRSPGAIVFATSGMDPVGVKNIHKYAVKNFRGALIHVDVLPCKYCQSHGKIIEIDNDLRIVAR